MNYNILIIGVGLIGGSLGLALMESPLAARISGVDINRHSIEKALAIGAINDSRPLEEAAREADFIFFCTSTAVYPLILRKITPFLKPGAIVSDVGSTKKGVMELFARLPQGVWGIGGHPMAGAETQGISGSDRYLFENAVYILTPPENVPYNVIHTLMELLEATGAQFKIMDAGTHDRHVAAVSHIPHLCAVALVNSTGGDNDTLMMAAGGFRDITRIASSNPALWEEILFSNRSEIVAGLKKYLEELLIMREALDTDNRRVIRNKLQSAGELRENIPRVHKGIIPRFCDIICIVPDRPGIIGQLGNILGKYGINIVDIEILRVREGDGGTMRLGVPAYEQALQAIEALKNEGIKAWVK